ncbi:POK11 protein, partial [Psilopogon haemacephalus]|nr:POK11 protein [Psilopogon haemacephalus]
QMPLQRYHWTVLPQGMKNSPTICQWYVAKVISPICLQFPQVLIYHYMDDLLIAASDSKEMENALRAILEVIQKVRLCVSAEKVQKIVPWRYLGWKIRTQTVKPQQLTLQTQIKNLHDVQKVLGSINWLRPLLGVSNSDLSPLFELLKGDTDITGPRSLTPAAKNALEKVTRAIESRQAHHWHHALDLFFIILWDDVKPSGLLFQWDLSLQDPLMILEWIFLSHQSSKTILSQPEMFAHLIMKARERALTLTGSQITTIYAPLTDAYFVWLMQISLPFQVAIQGYSGQLSNHPPPHKLFHLSFSLAERPKRSLQPLDAVTFFTDGSGWTQKSVIVWKQWNSDVTLCSGSPQLVELAAVVRVFQNYTETPFNLVTDSAYVARRVTRTEATALKEVSKVQLFDLLQALVGLLNSRQSVFFVMHIRSHSDLPGFLAEGNRQADLLTLPVITLPDHVAQAKLSHLFSHQNAKGLKRQFELSMQQASKIIASCPDCRCTIISMGAEGVNPCGLHSLELWQTDVTHIPEFGIFKYSSIDTFSGALFSSCHKGEK